MLFYNFGLDESSPNGLVYGTPPSSLYGPLAPTGPEDEAVNLNSESMLALLQECGVQNTVDPVLVSSPSLNTPSQRDNSTIVRQEASSEIDETEDLKPKVRKKARVSKTDELNEEQIRQEITRIKQSIEETTAQTKKIENEYQQIRDKREDKKLTIEEQAALRLEKNRLSACNSRGNRNLRELETKLYTVGLEKKVESLENTVKIQEEKIKRLEHNLKTALTSPQVTAEVAITLSPQLCRSPGLHFCYNGLKSREHNASAAHRQVTSFPTSPEKIRL